MGMPLFFESPKFSCDLQGIGDFVPCDEKTFCYLKNNGY